MGSGDASALAVGQYLRVFPARTNQLLPAEMAANGDDSFAGGIIPLARKGSGTTTVAFDASSSYGHGHDITSTSGFLATVKPLRGFRCPIPSPRSLQIIK